MLNNTQDLLTSAGFQKLKEELEDLKKSKRPQVAKKIKEAKELGDLSENAEYLSAKEEQSFIEGRILELESILKNAKIVRGSSGSEAVKVGSSITVKAQSQNIEYYIVGSQEADPANGKISHKSPLGKAFLGRKQGEEIVVEVPAGKLKFKLLKIG